MVISLNRKQVEQIVDELLNSARKVPRGPISLVDLLMMNAFERSEMFDSIRDPVGRIEREVEPIVKKVKRKKSKYGKALSRELKSLNRSARTKSGRLRKGITQGSLLKKAHRNVKRSMKRGRK
ncbi:unnamed protein product [marine sediment metagenome]|uniref:Uncharacterized protein n=1 Tax=marine sediment metagenome TaxID=412755 RepID=X1RYH7_9ZZZZ